MTVLTPRTIQIIGIAQALLPYADGEPDFIQGIPAVALCDERGVVRVAEAGPRTIVEVARWGALYTRSFPVSSAGAREWLAGVLEIQE